MDDGDAFVAGGPASPTKQTKELKAELIGQVLRDPNFLIFCVMVFLFHVANGTVLTLVMQTLDGDAKVFCSRAFALL